MREDIKNEIWRKIPNYPDYEVSNLGRIKSLKYNKKYILKLQLNAYGYYHCTLRKDKKRTEISTHQLVAIVFLNHTPCGMTLVVDHKDGNKLNNNVDNLRIVTNRENITNCFRKDLHKQTSKYVGVYISKFKDKKGTEYSYIKSRIVINGKSIHLGIFKTEEEAHNAYQEKLKNIQL